MLTPIMDRTQITELDKERRRVLDAIDRRRVECSLKVAAAPELELAAPSAVRRLASSLRAAAWSDRTTSAEEGVEVQDDPGWAPSATLRIAALLDHLAELSRGTVADIPLPQQPPSKNPPAPPAPVQGSWTRIPRSEFSSLLAEFVSSDDVWLFDQADGECIARASSWRGEIVEVFELKTLAARLDHQQALQRDDDKATKKAAKETIARLELKTPGWAESLVRAGFIRPHFGPELTLDLFRRHVAAQERLDVTADVDALASGLVHHLARIVPRVDFSRAAITDLEIQRLADHDRSLWRKACRALESFPVEGPAWRSLGVPDATALLLARAEQGGRKAAGADALLAHTFEDGLRRAFGVQSVLLTADNGLARTTAARLPAGAVWVGYVDTPPAEERFVSPLLSWPQGTISNSRYSSLAELLEEVLICGVATQLSATDGRTVIELRVHLDGEHQFVADWRDPHLFMRTISGPDTNKGSHSIAGPHGQWPLRRIEAPKALRASGARVTLEQVAATLEWVRKSRPAQLDRKTLPLSGDAQNEAWNFCRAVGLAGEVGTESDYELVETASTGRIVDPLRALILRFEPVAKIFTATEKGAKTVNHVKDASGLGTRTFGAAFGLAVGAGLVWRNGEAVGVGARFVERDEFISWLLRRVADPVRISALAEQACHDLSISPVRFREALASVIDDHRLVGTRGGSAEAHGLDSRVLVVGSAGQIVAEQLSVDDLLGLRSLAVRQ